MGNWLLGTPPDSHNFGGRHRGESKAQAIFFAAWSPKDATERSPARKLRTLFLIGERQDARSWRKFVAEDNNRERHVNYCLCSRSNTRGLVETVVSCLGRHYGG